MSSSKGLLPPKSSMSSTIKQPKNKKDEDLLYTIQLQKEVIHLLKVENSELKEQIKDSQHVKVIVSSSNNDDVDIILVSDETKVGSRNFDTCMNHFESKRDANILKFENIQLNKIMKQQ